MKKSLIFVGMLVIGYANAQEGNVGINTSEPKATLDIQPNVENAKVDATTNQGIIIPKLSKARVMAIATNNLVEGTKVYVTDDVTAADTQFIGTGKGFYFYNGTKWVKQLASDTNSELWAQRDNNGVTETYLKPANEKTDFIGYRSDRKWNINLGNTTSSDFNYFSNTSSTLVGNADGQIPHSLVITSDALPAKAELGGNNSFFFTKSDNIIRQSHLDKNTANLDAAYRGHELTLIAKDVTSNMRSMIGTASSLGLNSSNTLQTLLGAQFLTSAGSENGVYTPTVVHNIGARIFPRNYSTSTNLRALEVYPVNYGKADNLMGILVNTVSRFEESNVPTHTIQQLRGIDNRVSVKDNGTLKGQLLGIRNHVTLSDNTIIDGAMIRGIENSIELKSLTTNETIIGEISAFKATGTTMKAYEAFSNYSTLNNNASIENYSGYRFTSPEVETGSSIKNLFGIRLYSVDKGSEVNYGLYIGNVSGGTNINHAIHTEAGKIRFGDLAQSGAGDRVVYADENGVLKTGVSAAANVKLATANNVECTEANTGTMNFGSVNIGGKATEAFGFCMKNSAGEYKWYYIYGGAGITTGSGAFGSNL